MLSLYAHIPFCRDRCSYCDFYSTKLETPQVAPYVDALIAELERRAAGRRFDTVFLGGGTPTSIPAQELSRLLAWLRGNVTLPADCEFTVEANPGTVTPEIATVLAEHGVTRVSMGAQSFDSRILAAMRRIHQPEQVFESVRHLRAAGIANLNVDLIFGWPGQTDAQLRYDLSQVEALGMRHLSCYSLSFEPGTALHSQWQAGLARPLEDDAYAAMYETLLERTAAMGLPLYEISNFAAPGFECRHNLAYWNYTDYIGAGVSAASFRNGARTVNVRNMAEYQRRIAAGEPAHDGEERLTGAARAGEIAMLKLRTDAGIKGGWWEAVSGLGMAWLLERLAAHVAAGRLAWDGSVLRLTPEGRYVSNAILSDCVECPELVTEK